MKAQSKLDVYADPIEFSRWFNDKRDHEPGGIFEYLDQNPVVNTHWVEGGQLVVEYTPFEDGLAHAILHVGQYVYVSSKDRMVHSLSSKAFGALFEIIDEEIDDSDPTSEETAKAIHLLLSTGYYVLSKDRYDMLIKYESAIQDVVSRFGDD